MTAPVTAARQRGKSNRQSADVVVIGAGMAGLAAAARAADAGAKVTLLEKAARLGGTVPLMGGFIWTARDLPTFMGRMTHADPQLAALAVNGFEPSVAWLGSLGVTLGPRNNHFFDWGHGYRMVEGASQYVDVLSRFLRNCGASIHYDAVATGISVDPAGAVSGVRYLHRPSGRARHVRGRAVVIATGGFAANVEMRSRYLGRWADRLFLRATPLSTGDGIEIGLRVGARPSRGYHAFYGQLMPAPPAAVEPADFRLVTQYNSIHMILLNQAGNRFVDESIYDSITAQALSRERDALGYLITDGRIDQHDAHHRATPTSTMAPTERMRHIITRGGVIIEADSVNRLLMALRERGVDTEGAKHTIAAYNEAAQAGTTAHLGVPKTGHAHPIATPPFYAIPVVPGISFTNGGLSITPGTQVVDWEGSGIPGLFAAGADAGGLFYEQYLGGAASSLVLGRAAGEAAAALTGS